jgi:NitT/TauT family transport system permease protein
MVEGDEPPTSWLLDVLAGSWLVQRCRARVATPAAERLDARLSRRGSGWIEGLDTPPVSARPSLAVLGIGAALVLAAAYGGLRATGMLLQLPAADWARVGLGLLATLTRVTASLLSALLWTIPVGVLIGTNRRLASILQPIVQVVASIPATAIFPVLILALVRAPGGLNLAAVLLMLMGTQWYLLFNVIAGAAAIPLDLRYTTDLLRLSRLDRWRTLILPALLPYITTGAITASGGAWNASIVAEHVMFGGKEYRTLGVGALIAEATAKGDYPLLLAGTLTLVATVVTINRTLWRRLYLLAEERYRMD